MLSWREKGPETGRGRTALVAPPLSLPSSPRLCLPVSGVVYRRREREERSGGGREREGGAADLAAPLLALETDAGLLIQARGRSRRVLGALPPAGSVLSLGPAGEKGPAFARSRPEIGARGRRIRTWIKGATNSYLFLSEKRRSKDLPLASLYGLRTGVIGTGGGQGKVKARPREGGPALARTRRRRTCAYARALRWHRWQRG